MRNRFFLVGLFLLAAMFAGPALRTADACPNCKEGISSDDRMPRAYQYSIIFMLAVPATIFTGFGYSFYRLSRRSALLQQQLDPELLSQYDARVQSALGGDDLD